MTDEIQSQAILLRNKCNRKLDGQPAEAVGMALMWLIVGFLVSMSDEEGDALEGLDSMMGDMRDGIKAHYAKEPLAEGRSVAGHA